MDKATLDDLHRLRDWLRLEASVTLDRVYSFSAISSHAQNTAWKEYADNLNHWADSVEWAMEGED